MYLTQWPNNYPLVLANVLLFMEITTHFVSGRWLLFEHGYKGGHILQTVCSVMLFLSFIFCRVVFETIVFIKSSIPYLISFMFNTGEQHNSFGMKVMILFMGLSIVINYILNWYWLSLIIKQVARILARGAESADTTYTGSPIKEK